MVISSHEIVKIDRSDAIITQGKLRWGVAKRMVQRLCLQSGATLLTCPSRNSCDHVSVSGTM